MKNGECEALWPNLRVGWDPPGPPSRPAHERWHILVAKQETDALKLIQADTYFATYKLMQANGRTFHL